jgi:tetratricopeptide (TPR) repeat protein
MDPFEEIRTEFRKLTGLDIAGRPTNRLEDRVLRKDWLFADVARAIFDNPDLLPKLLIRFRTWERTCGNEIIYALEGYVHYIAENYGEAVRCLFEAVTRNPENLDNWFDLGFALHHLESRLGYAVLFNFDLFIRYYVEMGFRRCHYFALEKIWKRILEEGMDYSRTFGEYISPRAGG